MGQEMSCCASRTREDQYRQHIRDAQSPAPQEVLRDPQVGYGSSHPGYAQQGVAHPEHHYSQNAYAGQYARSEGPAMFSAGGEPPMAAQAESAPAMPLRATSPVPALSGGPFGHAAHTWTNEQTRNERRQRALSPSPPHGHTAQQRPPSQQGYAQRPPSQQGQRHGGPAAGMGMPPRPGSAGGAYGVNDMYAQYAQKQQQRHAAGQGPRQAWSTPPGGHTSTMGGGAHMGRP